MSKLSVSVIIPNFNGQSLLENCLSSLKTQTFKLFETILVDNCSSDNSIRFTKTEYPLVKIVQLKKNFGFAKAINEGVKKSKGKFVVFLNNDTSVDKNWLKNLVETAQNHPEVVSVGCKLLNFYNRKMIDGVGISINEVGQAKSLGWAESDQGQYEKEFYIFGATGGGALFKKDLFIKIGMFDENFFMYSEEVDFAFRAQFLGYKSIYCPKAILYHKHKATSSKKPQFVEYWQFKNMTQTIIKDFPGEILIKDWRWLKIILVHFNTIIYQFKNGFFWPPLMTELWLLFHLTELLKKRAKIQKQKKVPVSYIESFLVKKPIKFWGFLR